MVAAPIGSCYPWVDRTLLLAHVANKNDQMRSGDALAIAARRCARICRFWFRN